MSSAKIFLSYRRDDSAGYTRLLFDRLNARFPNQVFMDVSDIQPGTDFIEAIETAVGSSNVFIANGSSQ